MKLSSLALSWEGKKDKLAGNPCEEEYLNRIFHQTANRSEGRGKKVILRLLQEKGKESNHLHSVPHGEQPTRTQREREHDGHLVKKKEKGGFYVTVTPQLIEKSRSLSPGEGRKKEGTLIGRLGKGGGRSTKGCHGAIIRTKKKRGG